MATLLFLAGCGVGAVSGALGLGGGILLAPVLLYLPPLAGLDPLDVRSVSGLTMAQGLASGLTGWILHRRERRAHARLAAVTGAALASAAFAGALASAWVSPGALLALFTAAAFAGGALMILPAPAADREVDAAQVEFRPLAAAGLGAAVGALGGLIGQGGAFLLNPALIAILKVPTRVAVGTTLGVVAVAAAAGAAGKAIAGQLALGPAALLAAGAVLGTLAGARLSGRIPARTLRASLAVVILGAAARMSADLLTR